MLKKLIQLIAKKQEQLQFQSTERGWFLPIAANSLNSDEGIFSWLSELPDKQAGQAFYLAQLVTEEIASLEEEGLIIPWQQVYYILADYSHNGLVDLLELPEINPTIVPVLDTTGTLSDTTFTLSISGWRQGDKLLRDSQLIGATLHTDTEVFLISEKAWQLHQAIQAFAHCPPEQRTQHQQEMTWGSIRPLATQANARYASRYLEGTIIITPESLKLELERTDETVYVSPTFDDAPVGWLQRFDNQKNVQKHYDFATGSGRSRVILSESVKRVLQFIKREMPQRKVTGHKAEAFIRNPYALLGETQRALLMLNILKKKKRS